MKDFSRCTAGRQQVLFLSEKLTTITIILKIPGNFPIPKAENSMFQKKSATGYQTVLDKIQMKTLAHGDKTLMSEFRLKAGAVLPRHSHSHEQTGYLVSGRMELTIGKQKFQVEPGDSWCITGEEEHAGLALEDTVAIEVFSPVREDYLP